MAALDVFRPMLAAMVDSLPAGPGWLYEPKWDGFRCLVLVDAGGSVTLLSRRGTDLTGAFPDVAAGAARQLPADTIADGEIVRWADDGHLDFEALQRRNRSAGKAARDLARTEPCHLIVFDLLRSNGHDLTRSPLTERRRHLEEAADGPAGAVVVGMQTADLDTARLWSQQLAAVGVEGIVAKRARDPYRPGVRGWFKMRHYSTTEAIIGGITGSLDRPESLVLGRIRDNGRLHIAGYSTELHPSEAEQIAAVIRPAGEDHPWPAQLPPSWNDRAARDYHRLVPDVVAEIRVDVATTYTGGAPSHWRHRLRSLRLRPDLNADQVPRNLDLES